MDLTLHYAFVNSNPVKYAGLDLKNSPSHHSSYGYGGGGNLGSFGSLSLGGSGSSCFALNICPDLLLAAVAAGGAAAVYLLYRAITVKAGRKKRDAGSSFSMGLEMSDLWDAVNYGMIIAHYSFMTGHIFVFTGFLLWSK